MDNSLQEERWLRRGHTRKPNFVVRSIYAVADWIGDFGPLFGSAKRGAGHLSAFAGHSLLLIVTLAITLLLVVTSAIHSFDLLNWIGFHGWTVYPILFVVEAIFITGSIQMDLAFKHGKYFPIPPILGFLVGLAFVLASNVTGLADNWGGLIFGIATPFLLIIAKAMLAWQYTFRLKIATQSIEEKPSVQVEEIIIKNDDENESNLNEIATDDIQDSPHEIEEQTPPKTIEENHDITIEKVEDKIEESTPEIATEKIDESEDDIEQLEKISTIDEQAENKSSSLPEEVVDEVAKKPSKTPTKKKVTKKKKTTVKVDDLTIEKIALDYQKEHGELPGRPTLAKLAKCSEYKARKVLAKLEETPPETEEKIEQPKLKRVK